MNADVRGLITINLDWILQLHIFLFTNRIKSANNDQRNLNEPFRNSEFFVAQITSEMHLCLNLTYNYEILLSFPIIKDL